MTEHYFTLLPIIELFTHAHAATEPDCFDNLYPSSLYCCMSDESCLSWKLRPPLLNSSLHLPMNAISTLWCCKSLWFTPSYSSLSLLYLHLHIPATESLCFFFLFSLSSSSPHLSATISRPPSCCNRNSDSGAFLSWIWLQQQIKSILLCPFSYNLLTPHDITL